MKRILLALFCLVSLIEAKGVFYLKAPVFAPENEYDFIDKRQESALNDKNSGFYYRLSTQYVPPYLINLETDEYYLLKEQKNNKLSLKRLCKSDLIDIGEKSIFLTLKERNEPKERIVFAYSPYINGEKSCALNKEIFFLPVKHYKKPLNIQISLYETTDPIAIDFQTDPNFPDIEQIINKKRLQTVNFILDPESVKTNTVYVPLYFKDENREDRDVGFLTVILHPVASKVVETDFTDYGYPNLSKLDMENLTPLPHPFNNERNLKKDIYLLSKIAKNIDPDDTETCRYLMSFIKEYDLSDYDNNALFWLVLKNNPSFQESLCYKKHEKYLVYTNRVPQPKDFVIPVLKPEIPAKELPKVTLASAYNEVQIPFEANGTIKEFEDNQTKVSNLPNEPLVYNSESETKTIPLQIAQETNETERNRTYSEENISSLKIVYEKRSQKEEKKALLSQEKEKVKSFKYENIPFSGISNEERTRVFKIFSSSLRAKNKKRFFRQIFPKTEISFTLLTKIPALMIEGFKENETFLIDRNTLAQILSPLNKEKLGCWFLLRSMKIKDKKAVSLGEELNRDDYEMLALYKDKNKDIGNNGYLLIYVNYKRKGKNRFVIDSIAFDKPNEKIYEILKNRTGKKSKCYRFLKKFKKDIAKKNSPKERE